MIVESTLLKDKIVDMQDKFKKIDEQREKYIADLKQNMEVQRQSELKLKDQTLTDKQRTMVSNYEKKIKELEKAKEELSGTQTRSTKTSKVLIKRLNDQIQKQQGLINMKDSELRTLERRLRIFANQETNSRYRSVKTVNKGPNRLYLNSGGSVPTTKDS